MKKVIDYICGISGDKWVHLLACLLITFVVGQGVHLFSSYDMATCAAIGAVAAFLIGCAKEVFDEFRGGEDGQGFDYRHRFDHRPTAAELLKVITDHVDSLTDQKILTGYRWQGKNVYLSSENQFNYKAAYDLAVQTDGATLPVKFKFGTDDAPVYRVFDQLADLTDFYTKAMRHIQNTLDAGWQKKDAFSLAQYQTE